MRPLKTVVTVLAMFAWLFSISHCDLEFAGFIPLDNCAEVQAEKGQTSSTDPCDTLCKILEDSAFKLDSTKAKFTIIATLVQWRNDVFEFDLNCPPASFSFTPPHQRDISLFVARTSLPARAPSLVS